MAQSRIDQAGFLLVDTSMLYVDPLVRFHPSQVPLQLAYNVL